MPASQAVHASAAKYHLPQLAQGARRARARLCSRHSSLRPSRPGTCSRRRRRWRSPRPRPSSGPRRKTCSWWRQGRRPKCRLRTARTGPRRAHHWPSRQYRCVASLLILVRMALIGFSRCERVMQVTRRSKRDAIHSMQWPTHEALLTRRSSASDVWRTPTSCLPVVSVHLNQRTLEGAC